MPWFKVDDHLPLSPKFVDLPMSAIGLWTMAGAWCGAHLTDGMLSRSVVTRLGGDDEDAVALVKAGLWHAEPDGYRFHDWLDYQPSREVVLAERGAARERMREVRRRRKGVTTGGQPPTGPDTHDRDAPERPPRDKHDDGYGDQHGEDTGVTGAHQAPTAAPVATGQLGESVEGLRNRLDEAGLRVSWKGADKDVNEILALLNVHGPGPLVAAAKRSHVPSSPARSYRAWMGDWHDLRPPRRDGGQPSRTSAARCPIHPDESAARCSRCKGLGTPPPPNLRDVLHRVGRSTNDDQWEAGRIAHSRSAVADPVEGER